MNDADKVTVDHDIFDDEEVDYGINIEIPSYYFNKLMYMDLNELPIENRVAILIALGQEVVDTIQDLDF